jgi:pimeloyl-ACP methyl ester carboxylesterase
MTIRFEYLSTNGIRLHTVLAGPEDGQPVFLLHGFPEFWFGWKAQIGPLADSGFRKVGNTSVTCQYSILLLEAVSAITLPVSLIIDKRTEILVSRFF